MTNRSPSPSRALAVALGLLLGVFSPYEAESQEGSSQDQSQGLSVPRFTIQAHPSTTLSGPVRAGEYLGAVGSRAAWLGFETGEGEVWIHPLKVAREIRLSFKIPQYSDPIPGENVARRVECRPNKKSRATATRRMSVDPQGQPFSEILPRAYL